MMNLTDYNNCPEKKKRLSPACHDRYFDELCFFICSPDQGPWIDMAVSGHWSANC